MNEIFELSNLNLSSEKNKLVECNKFLNKYGLSLSSKDINSIIERRTLALKNNKRIELDGGIIDKVIREFFDSPYISNDNFVETINEVIELFYYYKNETNDSISDDDLLRLMREHYDNFAHGDLDYLSRNFFRRNKKENVLIKKNERQGVRSNEFVYRRDIIY